MASRMFSSAVVLVTPSRMFSSAVVLVTPSRMFSSAAVLVTAVLPSVKPVVVIVEANVAAPPALPSSVRKVVSTPPSVPLKIISLSLAAASIVILPELVESVQRRRPLLCCPQLPLKLVPEPPN